jgi:hypothetical protein
LQEWTNAAKGEGAAGELPQPVSFFGPLREDAGRWVAVNEGAIHRK